MRKYHDWDDFMAAYEDGEVSDSTERRVKRAMDKYLVNRPNALFTEAMPHEDDSQSHDEDASGDSIDS
jgi:hypothetical protein